MPKRTDISSILIIGAGPIVIGQACEFDYSGTQACKALKAEGYRIVLVNSNPATIMTDPDLADATYIEPITPEFIEKIIVREKANVPSGRVFALLPTMGGQTALNTALDLHESGVLSKYGIEMIGAHAEAIAKAEDRQLFREAMERIGLECPRSMTARDAKEAMAALERIGLPAIIRPSFTLGGTGGGIAYNREEFAALADGALEASRGHGILIEESVLGWKEYEMEVVRDKRDNAIIVCSIENIDPMGVHTGDSITVAPALTLTDKEYQRMRTAAIAVLREVGVETGGSNVQFALNPADGRMLVIEMNPRVSRSSALASKATGFPIAKVAAKLAIVYTLDELRNEITGGATPASFEPSIDYIVTKVPRFAFEKFPQANDRLTTQMKSVGEVMTIGRTFQESFQKALRGLEVGVDGLNQKTTDREKLEKELGEPGPERIWYVGDAFESGFTLEEVHQLTRIDPWFLAQIKEIVDLEMDLDDKRLDEIDADPLRGLKRKGFSDRRLAYLFNASEAQVRAARHRFGIRPVYKRVDTCAAEFATRTAYMYSTYEEECEAAPNDRKKVIVLGGGPNRIGQGIEFDYCCVHAALALREDGFETIMVNSNPETVSTDYDTSDKLFFEPLTLEDVLHIYEREKCWGAIAQFGGQTPLNLALGLQKNGVNIIGTSPQSIEIAEDRKLFAAMLRKLDIPQPPNGLATNEVEALAVATTLDYPILVRPSFVLGGRAMQIVYSDAELTHYMRFAVEASPERPVLVDKFLEDAPEVDVDCIADVGHFEDASKGTIVIGGMLEHIEFAGVHSGDAAMVLPPHTLSQKVMQTIREYTHAMARELKVIGLMNVQYAVKGDTVYVLEVNPRASRTVPFVSKAIGVPLAKLAAKVMAGKSLEELGFIKEMQPKYWTVKESVFPFNRFHGQDILLSPEMRSTGEVMGLDADLGIAYAKSQMAANAPLPLSGKVFISVSDAHKDEVAEVAKQFADLGFELISTSGTATVLEKAGLKVQ